MSAVSVPVAAGEAAHLAPQPIWRAVLRRPAALLAVGFLAAVVVASVGAPLLAPYDPNAQDLQHALAGPSTSHLLGTDQLGRDVLSRLMYAGGVSLLSAVETVVVFVVLGVGMGLAAGYLGGWVDRLLVRVGDLLLAMPAIIVLLMVLSVFPGDNLITMVTLGVISCPTLLRVVRGATISLREETYVKAARLSGLGNSRVMWRHILPRLAGPIIVQVSLVAGGAVLAQSALSFLGLSTPATQAPTWGNMVAQAANVLSHDSWLLVPTGGIIASTVLAFGVLGDTVRDATVGRSLGVAASRAPRRRAEPTQTGDDAGSLLAVRGLTIAFDGVTAVRDVRFNVNRGEVLGIVGESGCGKTITARSLLGLLPAGAHVTGGSARFEGRDVAAMTERELERIRGSRIALISQEPLKALDPSFRVDSQLIEVIRRHQPLSRHDAGRRAVDLLEMVRLDDADEVARRYPHELSGGMAQRVVIATALAGDPDLLIADEPTTALDVTVQAEILSLLRDLRRDRGMAIIVVTHDWGVIADLCDRAIVMYAGEVVEEATAEQLYQSPRHPYTLGLLAANPQLAPVGGTLPTIPGTVPPPSDWPHGCHFEPRCPHATAECGAGPIPLLEPVPDRRSRCIHADRLAVG